MRATLHTVVCATFALLLHGALAAAPAEQHPIMLKSIAETEVETKSADGRVEKKRIPLAKAVPGAEVIYTTTFTNKGAKPAGNVVINNPVPANTTYVAASAFGDKTTITYSVDGGRTFGAPDALTVKTAQGRERPATPADYTHIRWVYAGELRPGETGTTGFRVVVN